MTISVRDLAHAVNTCSRIPVESGMTTWELQVLNEDIHIIARDYYTGWFQEAAEAKARDLKDSTGGYLWQVLPIKKED